VEITGKDDAWEFDPPNSDFDPEPDAWISDRAGRRRTERPECLPRSSDFVAIGDLGDMADAADVCVIGQGGVAWNV
jgi:hypothetical protein